MAQPTQLRINDALARVERIDWEQKEAKRREGSQIALMEEFLRRIAMWSEVLESDDKWPFFSVAETLAARSQDARARLDDVLAQAIPSRIAELTRSRAPEVQNACTWHVQWCAIESLENVQRLALPAPYEPVLIAFELGGGALRIEDFMFQFDGTRFPLGRATERRSGEPVLELNAEAYHAKDTAWEKERTRE
jgi:hypothetical protein